MGALRYVAKYRPPLPMVCMSPNHHIWASAHCSRGIYPVKLQEPAKSLKELIDVGLRYARAHQMVKTGDLVVLFTPTEGTHGDVSDGPVTLTVKVLEVSDGGAESPVRPA